MSNPNQPTGSNIYNFLPGTIAAPGIDFMNIGGVSGAYFQVSHDLATRFITKSIDNPLRIAEFDDSLVDMAWWANPRYNGCKSTGTAVNKYTKANINSGVGFFQLADSDGLVSQDLQGNGPAWEIGNYRNFATYKGDTTFGLNPALQNETTAIYISNTVIGGMEEPEFAKIQNHSYVGIDKILIVDIHSDTVDVVDRNTEGYEEFHRFITNDLPPGGSFSMRVLDESISTNLKSKYYCKMNKGWLLRSFEYKSAGEPAGKREDVISDHLSTNNTVYFYRDGEQAIDKYKLGVLQGSSDAPSVPQSPVSGARLRYANINLHAGASNGQGDIFDQLHMGPSFTSSSIVTNKYTRQFYSGSFGVIENRWVGETYAERLRNSDLGQASRFVGINCLDFLQANINDTTLTEEEKTELHVTFLEGVKDFSISISGSGEAGNYSFNKSANDERSIGTFEIDQNQTSLDVGDHCHAFLPQTHELIFKSAGDGRFMPVLDTFEDRIDNSYLEYTGSALTTAQKEALAAAGNAYVGCAPIGISGAGLKLQPGVNLNRTIEMQVFLQGGALGVAGHSGDISASSEGWNESISGSMTIDNYYGGYVNEDTGTGSLDWQLSFLDKDHTLIADINKNEELFNGIGVKGVVIIPEFLHPKVKRNLDIYLQKAGIIDSAPEGLQRTIIE